MFSDVILPLTTTVSDEQSTNHLEQSSEKPKRKVSFDTVTVYHFNRSQGFNSVPTQGGSTLGMKRYHFLCRKLKVDIYEEVKRRSRREILLKLKPRKTRRKIEDSDGSPSSPNSSISSSSSSSLDARTSLDSDQDSISVSSDDNSDSELGKNDNQIFLQPMGVTLRRSLLRASGVIRIDPKEKKECKRIRDSRQRSGCNCVNQCIPGLCECSLLGINCHVDRVSYPCGCQSEGCKNPQGRTEFDIGIVKTHSLALLKEGIG